MALTQNKQSCKIVLMLANANDYNLNWSKSLKSAQTQLRRVFAMFVFEPKSTEQGDQIEPLLQICICGQLDLLMKSVRPSRLPSG